MLFDIIVVGAGPIGMTVAIEAQKVGLSALIIDKGALVNTVYNFPTNMTFFSTSKLLEIGDVPFVSHHDKPTRYEALEYFRRVQEKWDLSIHLYEAVEDIVKKNSTFHVTTEKGAYLARYVVVATGFYDHPNLLNVPGESLDKVRHYYTEPHPYINQRVAVIGGANSACDVAMELYHKGAEVSLIVRGSELSRRVKYWIKPNIENRISEKSIAAYFNTSVEAINEENIVIKTMEGIKEIPNDFVLAMTGFLPDFPFLEMIGVTTSNDADQIPSYDSTTHESNVSGMYLAGVLCGGKRTNLFFIENAMDHATKIITDIIERSR